MSQTDAPSRSTEQPTEDAAYPGEAVAPVGYADDQTGASEQPAEKELLCTLCGLKACWT